MTYTLAYDKDSNSVFDNNDIYIQGVDSSANSIDISNLAYGRYRITVGSSSGCNLQSFNFFIFNCYGVVLPFSQRERLSQSGNQAADYNIVELWPNPTQGNMFISMPGQHSQFIYTIVGVSGAVVQKGRFVMHNSNNTAQLPTANLRSGIYQLLIYDEKTGKSRTVRFIKKGE